METDLFKDFKPQPKIYAADIEIVAIIPARGNKTEERKFYLEKHPVVMHGNEIATKRQQDKLFRSIYESKIKKSDFDKIKFKILSIKNIKFLSRIMYKFDYNQH
ncbi:MAG: hypothetical protein ACPGSG_07030 [Prolixibacteraceae bacterium]|jgi:hypothetical protein